ncbi:MAG: PPC domain-containing protein [Planctomycetota bacterium]|nr:PPC domain-containing protein [Planctomycetota bacterium]
MRKVEWLAVLGLVSWLAAAPAAQAQVRPYIGYVYPAGGQQGTTLQVKLGGQGLDDVNQVLVSGTGVHAKIVEYFRRLGAQETTLLSEQLRALKRGKVAVASTMAPLATAESPGMNSESTPADKAGAAKPEEATRELLARIEKRLAENVQRPASVSIANLVFVEVTLDPEAKPGERELRLATPRGVSNPLVFHVGQLPEISRTPMRTSNFQVLGKEELALRKRPADEVEQRITLPCTVNGQVASGEVNRYRFEARKGQRLLLSADARELIPFIADAVPGWFQPVLALYDAKGKEVAYNDDYRFQPDPVVFYKVPQDGEYTFTITDAIYRGREDFVYRVTIGELPFVTSIFPLGGRVGAPVKIKMKGWNLEQAELTPPPSDAGPGIYSVAACKAGFVSNRLAFALDSLPEGFDKEPNNDQAHAQKVTLPIIVNGRIDRPDDVDVFQVAGRADDTIVAEVSARRLDSPLDSVLRVTDATGQVLAFNDDHEDAGRAPWG